MSRPFVRDAPGPGGEEVTTGSPRNGTTIPGWAWVALSCLLGLITAVSLLHLARAVRHLPG